MLAAAAAGAQSRHPVSGRVIAPVMGYEGAGVAGAARARETRSSRRRPLRRSASSPARWWPTSGAGSGYYTVRLAKQRRAHWPRVRHRHPAGDARPAPQRAVARAARPTSSSCWPPRPIRGCPRAGFDLILMVDVYHELARPQEVLRKLRAALKPDGRLVLIEFRKESAWVPIREEHKMSVKEARMELEAEGYRFDRVIDVLPWQHILVFRR
ncbi:MAG: class I SAM-dependent methyltransferase [Comamonadaceae bacterium]|nr:class I SAM-dependent methyltransferase [Comamonadaceae bacterium]